MKNIYLQILNKQPAKVPLVLATITGTTGSTPQKPGSSALFGINGLLSGTVGGGIMEAKVQQIAQAAVTTKKSGYYHFNLDHSISQQEEAICGGQVSVLVDAAVNDHLRVFEQIRASLAQRIPGVLVTRAALSDNNQVSLNRWWAAQNEKPAFTPDQSPGMENDINSLLADSIPGKFREIKLTGNEQEIIYILEPVFPVPKLVIAGAGHIGKALAHLGGLLEFEVMVIDERAEFANRENLPDADHIVVEDIGRALRSLEKNADTYIVIVTRGHKNDADALKSCIGLSTAYVGMIGSKKKIALMRKNFLDEGQATPAQWGKIYAPIGLFIHSKTVQEIAISIAAQLIKVRNAKTHARA